MKYAKYFLLSLAIIALDQAVKLWVYFNMVKGQEFIIIPNWLKIHYITNPGMAFGIQWDWEYGKLVLSLFRIVATIVIALIIKYLVDKKSHRGLVWCVALILGGAIGNVLDSTFYGVFLGNAPAGSPTAWFHGQVIDMFYVDIWQGYLPAWMPLIGGQYYSFWPIFNVADSSIFIGVAIILIRQGKFFKKNEPESNPVNQENTENIQVANNESSTSTVEPTA
jgi:signal peptidase II